MANIDSNLPNLPPPNVGSSSQTSQSQSTNEPSPVSLPGKNDVLAASESYQGVLKELGVSGPSKNRPVLPQPEISGQGPQDSQGVLQLSELTSPIMDATRLNIQQNQVAILNQMVQGMGLFSPGQCATIAETCLSILNANTVGDVTKAVAQGNVALARSFGASAAQQAKIIDHSINFGEDRELPDDTPLFPDPSSSSSSTSTQNIWQFLSEFLSEQSDLNREISVLQLQSSFLNSNYMATMSLQGAQASYDKTKTDAMQEMIGGIASLAQAGVGTISLGASAYTFTKQGGFNNLGANKDLAKAQGALMDDYTLGNSDLISDTSKNAIGLGEGDKKGLYQLGTDLETQIQTMQADKTNRNSAHVEDSGGAGLEQEDKKPEWTDGDEIQLAQVKSDLSKVNNLKEQLNVQTRKISDRYGSIDGMNRTLLGQQGVISQLIGSGSGFAKSSEAVKGAGFQATAQGYQAGVGVEQSYNQWIQQALQSSTGAQSSLSNLVSQLLASAVSVSGSINRA